ncbi:MAG: Holliday junction resolvase RuvX [Parcubacteria group bacterium]|jgi:putative Holliday junction resolvase
MQYKKSSKISHILGIDFGKSKIGLAMADTETKIAFVYGAIKNDKKMLSNLEKIIEKESVEKVIIGLPGYMIETSEEADQKSLGKLLEINTGVRVEYFEEMFTTKMAQANLKEKGAKNISKSDDAESAKIILQEWMDSCYN